VEEPGAKIAVALASGKQVAHQVANTLALLRECHHPLQNAFSENLTGVETL